MRKLLSVCLAFALLFIASSNFGAKGKPTAEAAAGVVPVLVYHVVTPYPQAGNTYQISLSKFQEQMAYLKNNGYTTLSATEYYNILTGRATAPAKPILLTFDDNTADFNTYVFPVLRQYGFKAIQFVVSDWVDRAGYLTSAQLRTLAASGIDIQNHTKDHQSLPGLSAAQKATSISTANTKITSITGKKPTFLAYPYGSYDAATVSAAQAQGIVMAFKVGGGKTTSYDDKFGLGRGIIVNTETLSTFISKIQ